MTSTDERVVKMRFDNAEFKKNAVDTQKQLGDLNKSVDAAGKSKGLLDLSSNMHQVGVSASKMAIVTTTALATITNKVVNVGLNMAKSLTLDPIRSGFQEYESLLAKQNTIMNATGKSAGEVKRVLNDLNTYSDKTIFSFADMTEALTSFVNAGVPLESASQAMQGIANASALAGASTMEAQSSFRAFSQALGQGFLGLQDYRQAAVTGKIGTVGFKQSLIDAAVEVGTLTKRGKDYVTQNGKVLTATKGFDLSLQTQWANTTVLNKALRAYGDENTALGKKAFKSAQDVRTFSAFMDTLKESIGSGWSQVFTNLIGGLDTSTKLWSKLSQTVGGAVGTFFNFTAGALRTWRVLGGFRAVIHGIKNIAAPFAALFTAIGTAFHEAFDTSASGGAGSALYTISAGFEAMTKPLRKLAELITASTPFIKTFFQIIGIGISVVKSGGGAIVDFVKGLFGLVDLKAPSSGGMLGFVKDIAKAVANAVDEISDLLKKGASLKEAFGKVDIKLPKIPSLPNLGGGGAAAKGASKVSAMASGIKDLAKQVLGLGDARKTLDGVGSDLETTADKVQAVGAKMGVVFSAIGGWLKDLLGKINMKDIMASFNLAVLATFSLSISRFFNTMSKAFAAINKAAVVDEILKQTGGAVKAFQNQARAKLIMSIAIAIGVLAVSLWLLSKIPADKLATGLAAMGVMFVMLNLTMRQFSKVMEGMENTGTVKLVAFAVAVGLLAGAMLLLATAMLIMNRVKWSSIVKGLGTMVVTMKVMEKLGETGKMSARNMIAGAVGIGLISASMIVLAGALLLFQLVKWESIAKAGVVLAGLSVAVGLLALIPYQGIAKVGVALLVASLGILALANALILFALVKWESIGKAAVVLTALTLSLAVIVALGGPASAAAMLGLAGALLAVAFACLVFNKVDWQSIGKASVALTVLLLAFAVGAAILTVFLYAIAPVAPVLIILAAGFFLLGLGLLAFAAAMAIAITLGAAGVAAFAALATGAAVAVAVFMQTLAQEAPILKDSFLQILQSLIDTIVEAVPMIIQGIKDLWKAVKKELTSPDKGKDTGEAGKTWIQKLGDGIKKVMPKIADLAVDLFKKFLGALDRHLPEILTMGLYFVTKLIQGIGNRLPALVNAATDLVIKFAQALGKNAAKLANAGVQLIATFLHDLADAIRSGSEAIGAGLADVTAAMATIGVNMIKGLVSGLGSIENNPAVKRIAGIVNKMIEIAKKIPIIKSPSRVFMDIGRFMVEGLTNGVQDNAAAAITAVASMVSGQIAIANEYVSKFIQNLDQQSIAARAKAEGLALAAERAAKSAERQSNKADKSVDVADNQVDKAEDKVSAAKRTKKNKADDKAAAKALKAARAEKKKAIDEKKNANAATRAANLIERAAERADAQATAKEEAAEAAKAKQDREDQFGKSDLFEKAKMRSEDAQTDLDLAKQAEARAARARIEAAQLDKQAKAKGVSPAERKKLEKAADDLRKQARIDAAKANEYLNSSKKNAVESLAWQTKAGAAAAAAFEEQFKAEAQSDADAEAFEKLTDTEKATKRREQAAALQKKAEEDLATAKQLAYTDLEAANTLAERALNEADLARQYVDEAADLEKKNSPVNGTVVNLAPTDAAQSAFNQYSDTYDAAYAAAAAAPTVEFNQYNTSPESLSEVQIYRQTDNLVAYAASKLVPTP